MERLASRRRWASSSNVEKNSPTSSVLNQHCQAHDVKNLFVADGGPFVSQADKNPTWTILALAMRTGEYIAAARGKGEL